MEKISKEILSCTTCNNDVKDDDEFCPYCGSVLIENVYCDRHHRVEAEGVCIIYYLPFCKKCGSFANNLFLCDKHCGYEIYVGMARIYSTLNDTPARYAKLVLNRPDFILFYFAAFSLKEGSDSFVHYSGLPAIAAHIL